MKTCCFTGHRPQSLPFGFNESDPRCGLLKEQLRVTVLEKIRRDNVTHFMSGLALGVDTFAAEIVLEVIRENPVITLEGVIPCLDQPVRWYRNQKLRYCGILERCTKITVLQERYTYDCMHRRNRYMVDNSDFVIAVWNGRTGGTGKTVRYAELKNVPVTVINTGNV